MSVQVSVNKLASSLRRANPANVKGSYAFASYPLAKPFQANGGGILFETFTAPRKDISFIIIARTRVRYVVRNARNVLAYLREQAETSLARANFLITVQLKTIPGISKTRLRGIYIYI